MTMMKMTYVCVFFKLRSTDAVPVLLWWYWQRVKEELQVHMTAADQIRNVITDTLERSLATDLVSKLFTATVCICCSESPKEAWHDDDGTYDWYAWQEVSKATAASLTGMLTSLGLALDADINVIAFVIDTMIFADVLRYWTTGLFLHYFVIAN